MAIPGGNPMMVLPGETPIAAFTTDTPSKVQPSSNSMIWAAARAPDFAASPRSGRAAEAIRAIERADAISETMFFSEENMMR